ncbi:molybdopterin-dependent oxidoreductase [PVC group bacterium]|nr:molybdopterin-dependent oxidoreductase [PVC group bacterium]
MGITRRTFLKISGATGMGLFLASRQLSLYAFESIQDIENPLDYYPNRDWEKIYRDQYKYDSTFSWVCSPNDTHACRCMAYVRNGIVFRLGSEYNYENYADLYGNKATVNWNPRQCAKGYTFHRLLYGPYRLKYPLIRRGWRQWADDGFPDLNQKNKVKYKFDSRGTDTLEKVSWDEANTYIANAMIAIAKRYSGDKGRKKLKAQGYPEEMLNAMHGAGTRTFKMRGGMGLLGVFGKYGMYRLSNTMALLDTYIRGVDEKKAKGARAWSNYTWHGDQAPGHPWVHGLQNADCDFNDLRSSKLIIQDGKNLVENKMTDSHWFIECMERGAKLVTISPEYSPPSTKSDYWIPIRPGTDAALFLGITRIMFDQNWYDRDFVLKYTDFPLLVRLDNLRRLRANDIFPDYQLGLSLTSSVDSLHR